MKWMVKPLLLLLLATVLFDANAVEADIGPVSLSFVATVGIASGGHQAGNLEVEVAGGFPLPANLSCDNKYITTLRSSDSDKRMFNLLTAAFLAQRPVSLRITDDAAYRAVSGRCSLVWVVVR